MIMIGSKIVIKDGCCKNVTELVSLVCVLNGYCDHFKCSAYYTQRFCN